MSRTPPTRRTVLAASVLLAPVGCQSEQAPPRPPRRPDPDARLRREVAADVRRLRALYVATLERHPQSAVRLRPLMSEHEVHLRALLVRERAASPTATASGSTVVTPPPVAESAAAALAALARAEREAAQRRVRQLVTASTPLARLLAAIGASEAAHAVVLSRR